jgi:uncharacterized protein YlzI (FlbEa/FlbD family)
MTRETAEFLLALVNGQQLHVGASDFDAVLERILAARRELGELLADDDTPPE